MSDQVVPNTNDLNIATLAIAWEIAKLGVKREGNEINTTTLTNAVIKIQDALIKKQPLLETKN